MSRPSDETLAYYARNAQAFVADTVNVRMESLYRPLLDLLPPGGHILDAGCGSGRDAREFKRRGYRVTAIDASPEVARLAAEVIGQPVEVLRFQEMDNAAAFDGVWASAALVHVPRGEIDDVLVRLGRSLRPGGVLYVSFKVGEAEGSRNGRWFNDYTEESLAELLGRHPLLETLRLWRTEDLREGREGQLWLNALARMTGRRKG
jgi:SAM-dependent methyltransferase